MKNYILFLILTFTTLNVQAKWIIVTSTETSTWSVDMESYKRNGPIIRYWQLRNYLEPQSDNEGRTFYLSSKIKVESNCHTDEYKYLAIIDYSKNDGSGNIINSHHYNNNKQYNHLVPDSIAYTVDKFVCNKK